MQLAILPTVTPASSHRTLLKRRRRHKRQDGAQTQSPEEEDSVTDLETVTETDGTGTESATKTRTKKSSASHRAKVEASRQAAEASRAARQKELADRNAAKNREIGIIVGVIVGVFFLIVLLILLAWWKRKREAKQRALTGEDEHKSFTMHRIASQYSVDDLYTHNQHQWVYNAEGQPERCAAVGRQKDSGWNYAQYIAGGRD